MENKKSKSQYGKLIRETTCKNLGEFYKDKMALLNDIVGGVVVSIASGLFSEIKAVTIPTVLILLISVLSGLFTVFFSRFIFSLFRAPYLIFRDKELELEKYTWETVSFDLVNFPMIDGTMIWALRMRNNKIVPILGFYLNVVEISSKGKIVFHESNHLARFGYIYKDGGATRERIVLPHEVTINEKTGLRKTEPFKIEPNIDYDFVLTKMFSPEKYVFEETNPTRLSIAPKNIVIKIKARGVIESKNEFYESVKMIDIYFDEKGKPKKLN